MLTDIRIIQQHGGHAVLLRGRDDRYLRALQYDHLLWLVMDVRDLAASLTTEIPALPWSDTEGLVRLTLQQSYAHADALRARAVTSFRAGWAEMQGTPGPRLKTLPAGRALDATCWQRSGTAVLGASA